MTTRRTVEFYHLELPHHDVLLANGAPAESYRDDGNRWLFRNTNDLWGQPPKPACAPVLTGGPLVDAVWRRLLDRAGRRPGVTLTDEPELHLLCDGTRIDPEHGASDWYVFRLPRHPGAARLVSHAGSPAELGLARDPRMLGVAVREVRARQGTRFHRLEAGDARLADGFHNYEAELGWRWTDGDAGLPDALWHAFDGPTELLVRVAAHARYAAGAARYLRQGHHP